MSERLADIQRKIGAARRRLEDQVRRVAAVRERLAGASAAATEPPRQPPAPLFQGIGAAAGNLDDLELHFEVLDTEDPGQGRR
jgi:hypothetical protein